MGRRKGSKNKQNILDPKIIKDPPVKQSDIQNKMKILADFGISKKEIASLFEDRDFESLRALDCFTSSVIKNMLTGPEKTGKAV